MGAETQDSEIMKSFSVVWAGGLLPQTVLVILIVMSMVTWFITFTKLWEQRSLNKQYGDIQK